MNGLTRKNYYYFTTMYSLILNLIRNMEEFNVDLECKSSVQQQQKRISELNHTQRSKV